MYELFEAGHKNLHMTHVDELPILVGPEGVEVSLSALTTTFNKIESQDAPVAFNVKWDGAPAVYAGWDPETGDFIMALKALFAKNPKIIRQEEDIEEYYGDKPDLASKMVSMWRVLSEGPDFPPNEIWQGDFLYTSSDIEETELEGARYLLFQPNTIVYAVKAQSSVGQEIKKSEVGIVWHTRYRGQTLESMGASFDIYEDDLPNIPDLWSTSVHGEAELGYTIHPDAVEEFRRLEAQAITISSKFQQVGEAYQQLIDHRKGVIPMQINAMVNQAIKQGELMYLKPDPELFIDYLTQKYQTRKQGKDEKAQGALDRELGRILSVFDSEVGEQMKAGISYALQLQAILHKMKMIIMESLNDLSSQGGAIRTFLHKRDEGLKPANPEGFVVDTPEGIPLKFVDREQFSRANFSDDYVKGWEH